MIGFAEAVRRLAEETGGQATARSVAVTFCVRQRSHSERYPLLHAQISGFDTRHTRIRRLSRQCADNGGRKAVVGLTVAVRETRGRVGSRFGALFWCCGSPCPHIHTAASMCPFPVQYVTTLLWQLPKYSFTGAFEQLYQKS